MPDLPQNQNLTEILVEQSTKVDSGFRPYLGYSLIGHKCSRYIWYSFRWAYANEIIPQQMRIFRRGHQEEANVVADLRKAGIDCSFVLDEQLEVEGIVGHAKGHPDGICINVPEAPKTKHLLEIKSVVDKIFRQFYKFGVKRTSPQYWGQVQCYMGKLGLTRTLFVITNKNNEARIYERIRFDKYEAQELDGKAFDIITSPVPLTKLSEDPSWYECKICEAYEICHRNAIPERNCRTCEYAAIKERGEWHCDYYRDSGPIPLDVQRTGCRDGYRRKF